MGSDDYRGTIDAAAMNRVLQEQTMAVRSFAPRNGLVRGSAGKGRILGPWRNNPEDRAAMALVYYATLADLSFDSFQDRGDIIVDGNVTTHTVLGAMLSALRDGRAVYFADASSGRTGGAGILAGAPPIELPLLSGKRQR